MDHCARVTCGLYTVQILRSTHFIIELQTMQGGEYMARVSYDKQSLALQLLGKVFLREKVM